MFPFELTPSQELQITEAKSRGDRRVVLTLTPAQRQRDSEALADMDTHRDDVIREAREAIAAQRERTQPIADQLRRLRAAKGMSLAEVGAAAEMSRQAVLAIESGKNSNPKIDTLHRIAMALGAELQVGLTLLGSPIAADTSSSGRQSG